MAVDGSWNITISSPMGEREVRLDASTEGGTLTGTWNGPQGSSDITGGTVEGDSMAWRVEMSGPMGAMTLAFEAIVSGDEISGTATTPQGEMPFKGKRA